MLREDYGTRLREQSVYGILRIHETNQDAMVSDFALLYLAHVGLRRTHEAAFPELA